MRPQAVSWPENRFSWRSEAQDLDDGRHQCYHGMKNKCRKAGRQAERKQTSGMLSPPDDQRRRRRAAFRPAVMARLHYTGRSSCPMPPRQCGRDGGFSSKRTIAAQKTLGIEKQADARAAGEGGEDHRPATYQLVMTPARPTSPTRDVAQANNTNMTVSMIAKGFEHGGQSLVSQ